MILEASIAVAFLLTGTARGGAVGECRELLVGHAPHRSCDYAIPKAKPATVPPKVVVKPKKPIEVVTPKPVIVSTPKPVIVSKPAPKIAPVVFIAPEVAPTRAPELKEEGIVGALTFLGGTILVMRGRRRLNG